MKRFLRLATASVLAAAGALALSAPSAQAATGIEAGWWWRANPGSTVPTPPQDPLAIPLPVTPPPPPTPPNVGDGLMVAATVDGPTAIAAVRATGVGGTLTLTIADNSSVDTQAAKLVACKTTSLWTPVQGGRWDDKPAVACDAANSTPGKPAADGKTVAFSVANLTTDGALDVAITSAPADPTTGATAPFEIVFKKPASDAFGSSASQDTATTTFSSDFSSSYSAPPDLSSPPPALDYSSPSTFTATDDSTSYDVGATTFTPGTPGRPATPPRKRVPAAGAKRATALQQAAAASARRRALSKTDDARVFALFVVLLAAAAGYFVTRQQVPALHGLGRVAIRSSAPRAESKVVQAGLGRFKRARTGPPPRLF